MFFIKILRILAVVVALGLIYHLLSSAGKKSKLTDHRRKFVKSSVIEKTDETSEADKEKS